MTVMKKIAEKKPKRNSGVKRIRPEWGKNAPGVGTPSVHVGSGGGGGSNKYFWVDIYTLRFFWGQEIRYIYFLGLWKNMCILGGLCEIVAVISGSKNCC